MSSFKSPRDGNGGMVFHTPKTYSPRGRPSPTPSKTELMMAELGFSAEDTTSYTESLASDTDTDSEEELVKDDATVAKYEAMKKEIEGLNSQREELLLKVKNFRESTKKYKSRCEKEQNSKWQQIKIMRKTHETHLDDKRSVIKNLQDVIEEQETRIYELEGEVKDKSTLSLIQPKTEKVSMIIQQLTDDLDKQHTENAKLRGQVLSLENDVSNLQKDFEEERQELEDEIMSARKEVNGTKNENISNGHREIVRGVTDSEKEVQKLKLVNINLKKELESARQDREEVHKLTVANAQLQQDLTNAHKENKHVQSLKSSIKKLEEQLSGSHKELNEAKKESGEIKKLTENNAQLELALSTARKDSKHAQKLQNSVTKLEEQLLNIQREKAESIEKIHVLKQQCADKVDADKFKVLETENARLRDRILKLETHEAHLKEATVEINTLQGQLQAVHDELEHLKENPEVVTKTVTVESEVAKKQLSASQAQVIKLKSQLKQLKNLYADTESQLKQTRQESLLLEQKIASQAQEMVQIKRQTEEQVEELLLSKEEAIAENEAESEEKVRMMQDRFDSMHRKFQEIRPGLLDLAKEYKQLRQLCSKFPTMLANAIQKTKQEIGQAIAGIDDNNKELVRKYKKEMTLRKKYHNELVDLKGNIRVFCRVRPIIKEDGSGANARNVVSYDRDDDGLIFVTNKTRQSSYEVDKVFEATSTQEELFKEAESLIISSIDGYNVCIFAYGQTGSGKTYTMEGPLTDPGLNQRALRQLFLEIEEREKEWDYTISVSVMEIYNETLRDLLSSDPAQKLDIKMSPEGGLYVPGLTMTEVKCVEDVNDVFKNGKKNRATACTDMNEHSSRSHALLCVSILGKNKTTGVRSNGKLNLVDLAGSERVDKSGSGNDTTRLKEAQNINKSLSSLGDVIHALRNKQNHIPYRNSKLTYLLQDSLGGDSKTLMVVQVSPVFKNASETQCSLNFAQRVRSVELGAATKKTDSAEVAVLREKLAQYEDVPTYSSPSRLRTPTKSRATPKK
ncbi:kinesin-like protein KIFC3 [Anneissia japonica]|uniref:kinesin-like protein KIFC3 n=1 Tax=Anneissia japonica TaxID=1529436 RepID=UPI0014255726|nr:kinesin-like protein KIFC3 [Anneissia japonica]